jgi:hypothetical protein
MTENFAAFAALTWNGDVGMRLTCACGAESKLDVWLHDVIECQACHRVWRPNLVITCEPATAAEIADYRWHYYGEKKP